MAPVAVTLRMGAGYVGTVTDAVSLAEMLPGQGGAAATVPATVTPCAAVAMGQVTEI